MNLNGQIYYPQVEIVTDEACSVGALGMRIISIHSAVHILTGA